MWFTCNHRGSSEILNVYHNMKGNPTKCLVWGNFLEGRSENMQWRVVGSNDKLVQDPKQQETNNSNINWNLTYQNKGKINLIFFKCIMEFSKGYILWNLAQCFTGTPQKKSPCFRQNRRFLLFYQPEER